MDLENVNCYDQVEVSSNSVAFTISAFGIPAYHSLITGNLLLYNHIPRMLRRTGIGILLMALSFFSNITLEYVTHTENEEVMCIFNGGHPTTYQLSVDINTKCFMWCKLCIDSFLFS